MRTKLFTLAGIALAAAFSLYSATQTWVTISLQPGAAASSYLEVAGQQINQSISPIALAALAASLALTIAGQIFRKILGVLVVLLGVGIGAIALSVLRSPEKAAGGRLTEVTGLEGTAQANLVSATEVSLLVTLTLVAAVALSAVGLATVLLSGRWGSAGKKYDQSTSSVLNVEERDGEPDRISDWESLNKGEDPSSPR